MVKYMNGCTNNGLNYALLDYLLKYVNSNNLKVSEIHVYAAQVSALLEDGYFIRANKVDRINSYKKENFYLNENRLGKWKRIKNEVI